MQKLSHRLQAREQLPKQECFYFVLAKENRLYIQTEHVQFVRSIVKLQSVLFSFVQDNTRRCSYVQHKMEKCKKVQSTDLGIAHPAKHIPRFQKSIFVSGA